MSKLILVFIATFVVLIGSMWFVRSMGWITSTEELVPMIAGFMGAFGAVTWIRYKRKTA